MPNLNIIRQDLMTARSELEEEIAAVDRVLQALNQPGRPQIKETGMKIPPQALLEAVTRVLRDSHRPLQNREIAERVGKTDRSTGRALSYLKQQGKASFDRNHRGHTYWRWHG